jgi:TonB-dependent receptor
MRHRFHFFLILQILFAFTTCALAEEFGAIEGLIVEAETGEPMLGVSVMIQGTNLGAATDLDGKFLIRNVSVGSHTIVAHYFGFAKVTITGTLVNAGKTTTLNFKMKSEALELGEVVIEARLMDNTEASLLSLKKRSSSVSDGISAEQIKKSPDSDAADAVKRVTGVTVVNDKYVFVRGMGERYNNTRLNGATIASPEPLKRVVPFDIISASLIDNIVINKTFTPDQPGDFAGGSIQLNTKEFPEKLSFSANTTSSYNDQSSLEEFYSYRGGNKDWLGVDDGTRGIPQGVRDSTADPQWLTKTDLQKTLGKQFSNTWEPRQSWAPFNGSRGLSFGNQSPLGDWLMGYLASLNYGNSYSRRQEKQYQYTAASDTTTGQTEIRRYQDLDVDRSTRSVNWGGVLDLNLKLSARHKLGIKSLYTRNADDEARISQGLAKEDRLYRNYRLMWTERSLATVQIRGTHELSKALDSRLEWAGIISRAAFDQPDRRDIHLTRAESTDPWQWLINSDNGFRRYGEMRDKVSEGTVDWSLPLGFLHAPASKLKLGGSVRTMSRTFDTRKFFFAFTNDPNRPDPDYSLPPELLLTPSNIDSFFVLREITRTLDSYKADMDVQAGYLMTDLALGNRWRVVTGARIEHTKQHFQTYPYPGSNSSDIAEGGPNHTDILPALGLTYTVNDKLSLRGAGSMTIANPDYSELVPTEDVDYFEGAVKFGNPKLKHTKIWNGDLRAEYYPSPGENLAIGVFYKLLTDPIEQVLISSGATERLQPQNLVDASNFGAELEFRKSLNILAPRIGKWISYFSAIGNLTVVSSKVVLKDKPYNAADPNSGILTEDKRPLMGQSEYAANVILAFDHPRWGSSVRCLFNTFGKRISQVGGYGLPDTYEYPFDKVDIAYNQTLGGHWSAKLQATNLLNSAVEFKIGDQPFQSYKVGRTYSLSLAYAI